MKKKKSIGVIRVTGICFLFLLFLFLSCQLEYMGEQMDDIHEVEMASRATTENISFSWTTTEVIKYYRYGDWIRYYGNYSRVYAEHITSGTLTYKTTMDGLGSKSYNYLTSIPGEWRIRVEEYSAYHYVSFLGRDIHITTLLFTKYGPIYTVDEPEPYSAPDYCPEYWNDGNMDKSGCQYTSSVNSENKQDNNNCYNYACNRDAVFYQNNSSYAQPGTSKNIYPNSTNGTEVKNAAVADGLEYYGTSCPNPSSGKIVVALLVGPGGFHWCRKDSNGYWSHKNGRRPVTNRDYSASGEYGKGNLIPNPQLANWGTGYSFYGYFLADSGTTQGMGTETIEGSSYPINLCSF